MLMGTHQKTKEEGSWRKITKGCIVDGLWRVQHSVEQGMESSGIDRLGSGSWPLFF